MATRLLRVLPALAIATLAACNDVPTGHEEGAPAPSYARGDDPAARGDNSPAVAVYRVALEPLNDSGVTGDVTLLVKGGELVVRLNAVGHVAGRLHPQHIHGFTDTASSCPTAAQDTDGDGIITIGEGSAAFGPVQVDLQAYPTPANAGGAIHYTRSFDLATVPFEPADLTAKTVVLHGAFVGDGYVASLPVACGAVVAVN
ncbi:MAG TPA: hypothetical protein VF212_05545 [Longimicrobiales bacterium]